MKRFLLHSVQGRMLAVLLLFMTVMLLVTWFVVQDLSQDVMTSEKSNKLLLAASLLDFELDNRMDEQQQQDVIVSFAQADSSTARKFGGSGLGLSVSKALSELMGGETSITNQPGKGSTFEFYVIAKSYKGDEMEEIDQNLADSLNQKNDKVKLLIVEDNEIKLALSIILNNRSE